MEQDTACHSATPEGSPSVNSVTDNLREALRTTLSVMFFVELEESEPDSDLDDGVPCDAPRFSYCVSVRFDGSHCGSLHLLLGEPLARYCHDGFQPEDTDEFTEFLSENENSFLGGIRAPGSRPTASLADSMREFGNIACGSFLSAQWPDGLFRVDAPMFLTLSGLPQREDSPSEVAFVSLTLTTTEGPIQALVHFGKSGVGESELLTKPTKAGHSES